MKWSKKTIAVAILVLVALIGALFFGSVYLFTERMYAESFSSEYRYSVTLETTRSLHNTTLMLPLPSLNGQSMVGDAILAKEASGIPDDWSCSLVEVEGGVMLEISADTIVPTYRNRITPIPISPGQEPPPTPEIIYSTEYSEETPELVPIRFGISIRDIPKINTQYPIGNEPLLSPKRHLTRAEEHFYPTPTPPPPSGFEDFSSFYRFESPVYAEYATDPDTSVSIRIEHEGTNMWWVLGWSGNSYREEYEITLTGSDPGWQYGNGTLRAGSGRYR